MQALQPNFLSIFRKKLQSEFVPHLPELIEKNRPKQDQDKKQLSRAFSAFVIHKLLNVGVIASAKSVVDDFDDNGLDAIYYDTTAKTIFLLQTKFMEGKLFDEKDAIHFRNGVELLLDQKFDYFNVNVKNRIAELNNAFDEAEQIKLIVAYIGSGLSEHAKTALKQLTENENHHEIGRLQSAIEEYGPTRIQTDLLAEQSMGIVNDSIFLSKWQHLGGPRDTHIGVALISDLVDLHKKHQKALYERNIRYFLGSRESDVNKAIQETLRAAPEDFFYLNNGVTALADVIETPKGTKITKRLRLRGLSIINGAQTISSAAEFVGRNPDCDISDAKVLFTIIKADSEGKFGRSVTRARNHQNPVSTGNFASLDPRQEDLRRELAYLDYSYHYRPEATPHNSDSSVNIITIEQAMKALALFDFNSRYPFWLKNEVGRFRNAASTEYQSIFTPNLTGAQLVNMVNFFRFVRGVIAANAAASTKAERLFYKHGVFVIASVFAKRFRKQVTESDVISPEIINQLLSAPLDQCRQTCWDIASPLVGQGRSVLAYLQNQGNTVRLMDSCMAIDYGLEKTDAYNALKSMADKSENFPQEKLFRYLATQAPQL